MSSPDRPVTAIPLLPTQLLPQQQQQHTHRRRFVVLGSRSVGKSSLVIQLVENNFTDNYYPTIENTFEKIIQYRNRKYACEIVDTAGQDELTMLTSRYAIGIHGYIIVYSVASPQSLRMVEAIYNKILNYTGASEVPVVVIGQKSDVGDSRRVTPEQGKELADRLGLEWIETSAKDNLNVDKAFTMLLARTESDNDNLDIDEEPPTNKCCIQ